MMYSLIALVLCFTLSQSTIIMPRMDSGAEIIDSHLSYMYNLRYSNVSEKFWFAADKSHPNAFYFLATPVILFDDITPMSERAQPFLAFDVITHNPSTDKTDFLIGSTYGPNDKTALIGLPLQVAASDGTVFNTYFPDHYFYAVTIDPTSLQPDGSVKFYLAGWKHHADKTKAGFVLAQARALLTATPRIVFNPVLDVLILESICYDMFSELVRPDIYINRDEIIVSVPGHCNAFYKTAVPKGNAQLEGQTFQRFPIPGNEKIVASILNGANAKMYYALKNYNSAQITIKSFDTAAWVETENSKKLELNETVPVFAIDEEGDRLFIATSGFDRIYQWKDVNGVFAETNVATLPYKLSQISSMMWVYDSLYFVTDEPDALIGRISGERFCTNFCGTNAYCIQADNNVPGICTCIENYALPPDVYDTNQCVPKREVEVKVNMIDEETAAYVFLALFVVTLIIGIIGWVMWWRSRNADTYADL